MLNENNNLKKQNKKTINNYNKKISDILNSKSFDAMVQFHID